MEQLTVSVLSRMLATAIAPVTLVGGIAFLLSIMATRYSRCIDRIRTLLREMETLTNRSSPAHASRVRQIKILYARIRALRLIMTFAAMSIFGIVLTICGSFTNSLFQFPSPIVIASIFVGGLAFLVAAVFGFTRDILISLRAIKVEIGAALQEQ
jgi:hypothetical protein